MGGDLQPGRLADRLVAGLRQTKRHELRHKKEKLSRNSGNKVQKACDICGAKNKLVHQYSVNAPGINRFISALDRMSMKVQSKLSLVAVRVSRPSSLRGSRVWGV
eukprot:129628-Pelagomonas_calceolata.AAC.1